MFLGIAQGPKLHFTCPKFVLKCRWQMADVYISWPKPANLPHKHCGAVQSLAINNNHFTGPCPKLLSDQLVAYDIRGNQFRYMSCGGDS